MYTGMWLRKCEAVDVNSFPRLDRLISANTNENQDVLQVVQSHLANLSTELKSYFVDMEDVC